MKKLYTAILMLLAGITSDSLEARIRLMSVENHSEFSLDENFVDGTPYRQQLDNGQKVLIGADGAEIKSSDGAFTIRFEEAYHSGFHRPHWKFHVWLEKKEGWSLLSNDKLLYAVIFYDGDGEVHLSLDKEGKLHVMGGYDVKDILYPWAKRTIGRGNPYLQIQNSKESDYNGVRYFDRDGFTAFGDKPLFLDDGCRHP